MLVNLSNHPLATWPPPQQAAAKAAYGRVVDLPFPDVAPEADADAVTALADTLVVQCQALLRERPNHDAADAGASSSIDAGASSGDAVYIAGEFTLVATLVARLQRAGKRCVCATSERTTTPLPDGSRRSAFRFVRFRAYPSLCASGTPPPAAAPDA